MAARNLSGAAIGVWLAGVPMRAGALGAAAQAASGGWEAAFAVLSLTAAAGGLWAWKRRSGPRRLRGARRGPAAVVRLASQALTPQASVHAVEWNGEAYLLACTAQQVVLLSRKAVQQADGEKP